MASKNKPVTARVFDRLSDTLLNGIDIHRCVAARALGDIAWPGSADVLAKALLDEDEDVRTDAMNALVRLGDPEYASDVLESLLGDPCPEVKLAAIEMLGNVNYADAVPWLLKLVTEASEEINWDANEFYSTGWDDWLDIQVAAISALGKMHVVDAVDAILAAIADEEGQDVTPVAIPVLAKLGDRGLAALEDLFRQGDARIRRRISAVLVPGTCEKTDALISRCLEDADEDVRCSAVEKIIEKDPGDPRLEAFYGDKSAAVRQLVVASLGAGNPEKTNDALSDPAAAVRQAAFRVIAAEPERFEKQEFSEVVRKAIAGVPEVAGDAAVAWAALIGEDSAKSLGEALKNPEQPLDFRLGLIEALTLLDDAGFPYLAEAAGDENRQVRVRALTALAEIARESPWPNNASETLLAALHGDLVEPPAEAEEEQGSDEGRQADAVDGQTPEVEGDGEATSTLDEILTRGVQTDGPVNGAGEEEASEPEEIELSERDRHFIELSKVRAMKKGKVSLDVKIAPHQDVRRFAARLLGDFDEEGVPGQLAASLEVDDDELKQSCLESLAVIGAGSGRLDGQLFDAVNRQTVHKDPVVRMLATRCLGFVDSEEAAGRLEELRRDENAHVRLEAVRGLGRKGGHSTAIIEALKDGYPGVREVAVKALAAEKTAMDELIDLTLRHDGMHREAVTGLLRSFNRNEAAEKYLAILEDEEQIRAWLVAIQALGGLLSPATAENVQAVA